MRALRYKCLVLDHDDTAVQSTPEIHYPAFCETVETLRRFILGEEEDGE